MAVMTCSRDSEGQQRRRPRHRLQRGPRGLAACVWVSAWLVSLPLVACDSGPAGPPGSPALAASPTTRAEPLAASPPPVTAAATPAPTLTPAAATVPTPANTMPAAPPQAANLAPNPSFEEGGAGVAGWRRLRLDGTELPSVWDGAVARSGGRSLKLERRLAGDCPSVCGYWTVVPIPIARDAGYTFAAWLRVSPSLSGPASPVSVVFRVLDAGGAVIEAGGRGTGPVGTDWTLVTIIREAPWPAAAAAVLLDIAWLGNVGQDRVEGDIWIDDVFFGPSK